MTSGELETFLDAWKNVEALYENGQNDEHPRQKVHERLAAARANIIRVGAAMEAQSPGKGIDMLAYMMASEWFKKVYVD